MKGFSLPLEPKITSTYRESNSWLVSHIRTFRKKLFSKIPLYMLL